MMQWIATVVLDEDRKKKNYLFDADYVAVAHGLAPMDTVLCYTKKGFKVGTVTAMALVDEYSQVNDLIRTMNGNRELQKIAVNLTFEENARKRWEEE